MPRLKGIHKFWLSALAGVVALLCVNAPASANLIMSIQTSSASPGGTGAMDVILTATANSFVVKSFSAELIISSSSVTFTQATTGTSAAEPYIFNGLPGDTFSVSTPPTTTLPNADVTGAGSTASPTTLSAGAVVGLEHLTYSVPLGTPSGAINVTFGSNISVKDFNNAPISFSTSSPGTINVLPEPLSVSMLAIGSCGLLLRRPREEISTPQARRRV